MACLLQYWNANTKWSVRGSPAGTFTITFDVSPQNTVDRFHRWHSATKRCCGRSGGSRGGRRSGRKSVAVRARAAAVIGAAAAFAVSAREPWVEIRRPSSFASE
jgi:hypothetical protein